MNKHFLILLFVFVLAKVNGQISFTLSQKGENNFYTLCNYYDSLFQKFKISAQPVDEENSGIDNAWKMYQRWKWFYQSRTDANGSLDYMQRMYVMQQKINEHTSVIRDLITDENWSVMGPQTSPDLEGNGRINCSAVDPTNNSIIWIGSPSGGLWKTIDGGATWATNTDLLPVIGVSEILIDPTNSSNMYIATGDRDAGDTRSLGVMKSTDGGATWNTTGISYLTTDYMQVHRLQFLPSDPNVLMAATNSGFYKSIDGGATWNQTLAGYFYDFEFKPFHENTIYLCNGASIYRSTDAGDTWNQLTSGLPTSGVGRMALAVSPADSEKVYVLCTDNINWGYYGLYRSVDGGDNWQLQSNQPNLMGWDPAGGDVGGQGWYTLSVAVSVGNSDKVYVGGVDIWKSDDGGVTWSLSGHWYGGGGADYVHADIHDITSYPGGLLLVGCDGGFYISHDAGANYDDKNGNICTTQFYRLGCSALDPGFIISGSQDNGTFQLKNGDWNYIHGGDGMEAAIDYTNDNTIYCTSQGGYLDKSINGGTTFFGITPPGNGPWVTSYVIDPVNHNTLYYCGNEIYKSTNGGTIWNAITSGQSNGDWFYEIAVAPSDPQVIYTSTSAHIFKTADGGATWNAIDNNLPPGYITYIAVKATNPNRVWVTYSGFSDHNKVFESDDGGSSWQNVSDGLPNIPIDCIAYENNSYDALYIGTDLGVYYKNNHLSDWKAVNTGLPNVIVDELEIQSSSGKLRAATFGRGIWETNLITPIAPLNDIAISTVINPLSITCESPVVPIVQVKNYGTNTITSAVIHYSFDNQSYQLYNFSGTLLPLATQDIVLNTSALSLGAHTFTAFTTDPNNGADDFMENDTVSVSFILSDNTTSPLTEGFESGVFPPANWILVNPDGGTTWAAYPLGGSSQSATSAFMDLWYYYNRGQVDDLITPDIKLHPTGDVLSFDVAYEPYDNYYNDTLIVQVSNDCGTTWQQMYKRGGDDLATGPQNYNVFVPNPEQWRTDQVLLNAFAGDSVLIRFRAWNGYGNSMYLDNINLSVYTSVENSLLNENKISVFPNPGSGDVTVQVVSDEVVKSEMKITDLAGRKILTKEIELQTGLNTIALNLAQQSAGAYLISINGRTVLYQKVQ